MASILVIDQDAPFAHLLAEILREHGHAAHACADVKAALERVTSGDVDVIVLEWTTAHTTTRDLCRIRAAASGVRIVTMGSRRDDERLALDAGADDHLVKPFRAAALEARIRTPARYLAPATPRRVRSPGRVACGRFEIDYASQSVWVDGVERRLSATPYRLLVAMLEKAGVPVERSELAREAFGAGTHVSSNCLDQHVRRLRVALGPARGVVKTCRGVGYRFEAG